MWSLLGAKDGPNTEESEHLGRKIYENFSKAFEGTEPIDGIELVAHVENEGNKNPILVDGSHIGVMLWCVPVMFQYAYRRLFSGERHFSECDRLTRCVLLCCADCTSAWNMRKESVPKQGRDETEMMQRELKLSRLVLRLHPKSSETFAHRRWVLARHFRKVETFCTSANTANADSIACNPTEEINKVIRIAELEYEVCKNAGLLQKSNYNAWAHKSWVTEQVLTLGRTYLHHVISPVAEEIWKRVTDFLLHDVEAMAIFARSSVSDTSILSSSLSSLRVWTRFAFLPHSEDAVSRSVNRIGILEAVGDKWVEALCDNLDLIQLHSVGREALWCYRKNLCTVFNSEVLTQLKHFRCQSDSVQSVIEKAERLFSSENEKEVCERFLENAKRPGRVEYEMSAQECYASRYFKFLNKFCQ